VLTSAGVVVSDADAIELLQRVSLFEDLGEGELAGVAEVAVPRRFEPGEIVFREGDEGDTCYIVRSGRVRATRRHSDGRSLTLAHFGPGEFFGELSMFDDEPRWATAETLEETEAIALLGGDMRRLLRDHPEIAFKVIASLGHQLREANARLARQSFQTVQSRVASVLIQLVADRQQQQQQDEEENEGNGEVLIASTQADVAQLAGTSRESASRFLAVLERAGIITQGRGKLLVHEPAALERYVY
jgi:CRP/FNR family transcriptional regulator